MSRSAKILWLLFAIDVVLVSGGLQAAGQVTIVRPLRRFVLSIQQQDSWRPMKMADEYLSAPHDRPVYDEMLSERGVKFQYPLSSLLFTRRLGFPALNRLSQLAVIVVIACVWGI